MSGREPIRSSVTQGELQGFSAKQGDDPPNRSDKVQTGRARPVHALWPWDFLDGARKYLLQYLGCGFSVDDLLGRNIVTLGCGHDRQFVDGNSIFLRKALRRPGGLAGSIEG